MFFLSRGNTTATEKRWHGRLIIPFYRDNKLIFYQGRSLTGKGGRYINSTVSSDAVILYNYNELAKPSNDPLFITEGFFDAYHLNGIAINGNELNPKKINVINQSRRQKIYVPDRYGNGRQAALNAIDAGWSVSIPDVGDCKDINQAIVRFGYMYVYKSLMDSVTTGFKAKVAINALCK
jgi:DNA primase